MSYPRRAVFARSRARRAAPETSATAERPTAAKRPSTRLPKVSATAAQYLRSAVAALAVSALGMFVFFAVSMTSSKTAGQPGTNDSASGPIANDFDRTRQVSRSNAGAEAGQQRKKALDEAAEESEAERAKMGSQARSATLKNQRARAQEEAERFRINRLPRLGGIAAPLDIPPMTNQAKRPPLDKFTMTGRFGEYGVWAKWHTGEDLAAPLNTPIRAAWSGVVTHVGWNYANAAWAGYFVVVLHPDGSSTLYAHQRDNNNAVKVGQMVNAGDVIGYIGMTGRTFGPHVHLEWYPPEATIGRIYETKSPYAWIRQKPSL